MKIFLCFVLFVLKNVPALFMISPCLSPKNVFLPRKEDDKKYKALSLSDHLLLLCVHHLCGLAACHTFTGIVPRLAKTSYIINVFSPVSISVG